MPLAPTDTYSIEKGVWTEADFGEMGWHDVVVHALAFDTEQSELMLDIDYLFAWVDPAPPAPQHTFWLSPSTLVFREVGDLKMQYDASLGFQLQGLGRNEPRLRPHAHPDGRKEAWRWTLEGNEGEISFRATGYAQFTRQQPRHHRTQSFRLSERGGVSFERSLNP